jgi:hypothetical protein
MLSAEKTEILEVTAENVSETGIYCIRDKKAKGYLAKKSWFQSKLNKGLKIKIAINSEGKQLGFIEYIPSEIAWRPIRATNYLFIQCIGLFVKEAKSIGIGTRLLATCEKDARESVKSGICAMSSDGPWMANKTLFQKNGFEIAARKGRYDLMVKSFESDHPLPCFVDWTEQQVKYTGWNLVWSDQCPWHEKSVTDLKECALEYGIELKLRKLESPAEAQQAPSGFGTFSLLKDGKLIEDHYLSRTRFETILKKELNK